jgi:hypothetical protein
MKPTRVDQILDDWAATARAARRPATPPRPVVVRSGLPVATLAGATAIVLAIAIAGMWLGRPVSNPSVGSSPSVSPQSTASAPVPSALVVVPSASAPVPSASAPATATSAPPSTKPTTAPALSACARDNLAAHITSWEGAAGHRIANVQLTVVRGGPCKIATMPTPQFVDSRGVVLIEGTNAPAGPNITLARGDVAKTLVQVGNYCGPAPSMPVSVAFVFKGGVRIVARPATVNDTSVPPCLSGPGSPGTIEMHPWAR